MAYADYRHCDVCDAKAFYDANLAYDFKEHGETGLFNVGDWKVLCKTCAKTHEVVVVSRTPSSEGDQHG